LHTGGEVLKTAGPVAIEAVKNTVAFNKVGVGVRDSKVSLEVLDRAARRLQTLFGEQILPLEDNISSAARKYLPNVVEQVGALPARLRLLGLPGEERARDLLGQLTELLRGDASDAPSRLGVPDSQLPEDIEWARAATRALGDEGETDIERANGLLEGLAEINTFFPGQQTRLATEEEIEAMQAILTSGRFHEQLADLRSTMRAVRERVRAEYVDELARYREALSMAQQSLETQPDWSLLPDTDREELLAALDLNLPLTPREGSLLADYKTLLIRFRSLPGLLEQLKQEIPRRVPVIELPPEEPDGPDDGDEDVSISTTVETVSVQEILPQKVLVTEEDLEAWLESLRALILEQLKAGKQVKLS
jgi:hypothetical protein